MQKTFFGRSVFTLTLCLTLLMGWAAPQSVLGETAAQRMSDIVTKGPWVDIRAYGAKPGDGIDDGPALLAAIQAAAGKPVVVPYGEWDLLTPVIVENVAFRLFVLGNINDKITTFTQNWSGLAPGNRAAIEIWGSKVEIYGPGHFVGPMGIGGVSQTVRDGLLIYDSPDCVISGLTFSNHINLTAAIVSSENVFLEKNKFFGGLGLLVTRSTDVFITDNYSSNTTMHGLAVHDRGGPFELASLPKVRSKRVVVSGNIIKNFTATNAHAVGITVDSTDDYIVTGNYVDGDNACSMAYSFALTTNGLITDNMAVNGNNTSLGTLTYTGIGMELDDVWDVTARNNTFNEFLIGYLVGGDFGNLDLHGNYRNDTYRESLAGSGAGQAAFVQFGASQAQGGPVSISGNTDGGNWVVSSSTLSIDKLVVHDMIINDYFARGIQLVEASPGSIKHFVARDLDVTQPGPAERLFNLGAWDVTIENITFKNNSVQAGEEFITGFTSGGDWKFRNILVENAAAVFNIQTNLARLDVEDVRAYGCTVVNAALAAPSWVRYTNVVADDEVQKDIGFWSPFRYSVSPPTTSAAFIGQTMIDELADVVYIAKDKGTGASDWVRVSP